MLFTIVSIDAVNEDQYDQACRETNDRAELLDFVEECGHLNPFSDGDSLSSMLPPGYCMLSEYGEHNYEIRLRCLLEGDEFLLPLISASYYPTADPEGFDSETETLTVYEVIDSREQIGRILDRYWPTISEWRKSLIVHKR